MLLFNLKIFNQFLKRTENNKYFFTKLQLRVLQGGPGNADKPFVWLQLESINSYDDPEKVKSLTPLLYSFLQSELKIEKVQSRLQTGPPRCLGLFRGIAGASSLMP